MGDSFGQWLRLRRKAVGLSQQELANQVGCSAALIRKIEADERRPSRQVAELLIQKLMQAEDNPAALLRAARARSASVSIDSLSDAMPPDLGSLTDRENEILALLAADLSDSVIAERLALKTSTVRWYVKQVYSKLGIHSRDEAAAYAELVKPVRLRPSVVTGPAITPEEANADRRAGRLINGLPQDIAYRYVGREQETAELMRLLRARARLTAVYGRSGIGKSALVCKVLADLLMTEDRPDGAVALGGTTTGISLSQVLSGFARLLDGPDAQRLIHLAQDPETSPAGKASLLLDLLGSGWYVLLIDNLETLQDPQSGELRDPDLRALFQAALERGGLCLLVASQRQLALDRIQMLVERRIHLHDGLAESDAVALLRQFDSDGAIGLRNAPDAILRRCVAITGGFPRALEALAGLLLEDPLLSVEQLCQDPLWLSNELSAIVQQAVARLDPLEIQVMQALSVFPRAVPLAAVAYVLEPVLDSTTLRSVLSHLVRGYFVHFTRSDQQFSLHTIDQQTVYTMLPTEDGDNNLSRQMLHTRAAAYFRQQRKPQSAWHQYEDILPILDEFEQRLQFADMDEAARLLLMVDRDYLWEWGQHALLQALHARLSGHIVDGYLNRQQRRRAAWLRWAADADGAAQIFQEVLADARAAADRQSEADALDDLAQTARRSNHFEDALRYHQQALALYREVGDRRGQAEALGGIGSVLTMRDPDLAQPAFREASDIHRAMGNHASLSYTVLYLGGAHQAVGDFEPALIYLSEALNLSRQHGLRFREAETLFWLAAIESQLGNYPACIDLAQTLLALVPQKDAQSDRYMGMSGQIGYTLLGVAQFRLGSPAEGLTNARRGYELALRMQFPVRMVSAAVWLSHLLLATSEYVEAASILERMAAVAGLDVTFWATHVTAQLAVGRDVLPLLDQMFAQTARFSRQGRQPLWEHYALAFLRTMADFLRGQDLTERLDEFRAVAARVSAPGLARQYVTLLDVLASHPGGERLLPVRDILSACI